MHPEDFKKIEQTKGEAKKVIEELRPDELAAVESISAGNGDVVICNSACGGKQGT